jgi:hypothetical protein
MLNNRETVHERKHAINYNNSILPGFTEAHPFIPIDGEVGLVAARCEEIHNLLCRFGVVFDDENAAERASHNFHLQVCLIVAA